MVSEELFIIKRSEHRQLGIEYNIMSKDNPFSGLVRVTLRQLQSMPFPDLHKKAYEQGLSHESIVAEISDFYPNGVAPIDSMLTPYLKRGVASRVHAVVLEDARRLGADLLYAKTTSDAMNAFLAKNEYRKFEGSEPFVDYYYRII